MYRYCLGIDLGGTSIKFGLFEKNGSLIEKWQIPTNKSDSGTHILKDIAGSITERLTNRNIDMEEIIGIGLGIPGPVIGNGFVSLCANLGWVNIDVTEELQKLFPIPVKFCVANDANAALMGEMWQGSGKDHQNLVMITIGTGIGGGVIINRRLVPGLFGAAGEFGHMPIIPEEERTCGCGRKGCLEQASSASGILAEAVRLLKEEDMSSSLRTIEDLRPHHVIQAAKAGDQLSDQVMNRAARYLGIAMACITGVLDPEVFIIGGGVSEAGPYLIDLISTYYRQNVLYLSKNTEIKQATLGNEAGIYGAASLVLFD